MSKKHIYTLKDLPEDRTNVQKVKKMTERQINRAAAADPDAPLLTAKELKEFKRVHPPIVVDVKKLRRKLHISQAVFAAYFGVSLRTLQDWEQGKRVPRGPARILLWLIQKRPKLVREVLVEK